MCETPIFRGRFRDHFLSHDHAPEDPGPDSTREYIHDDCGLSTPMPEPVRRLFREAPTEATEYLICEHCHESVHLSRLRWADTGEPLHVHLLRLRSRVPVSERLAAMATSSLGGATIGGLALFAYTGRIEGLALGLLVGAGFGLWLRPAIRQALRMQESD